MFWAFFNIQAETELG